MHSLTIVFGPAATAWTLLFKEEEKAGNLYHDYVTYKSDHNVTSGMLIGSDDFGQEIAMPFNIIHGMMLEDMDLSQVAAIERGLHHARTQAKAETKAMSDEAIKAAMRAKQQRPAVYQPGMPNGRGMM